MRKRRDSRGAGLLLVAMLVAGLVAVDMTAAAPASGHSDLKSASPAAGSVTKAAPATVSLVFNEGVLSATLTVTDGCGRSVPAQVAVRKSSLRATLSTGGQTAANGGWSVRWRAVSADGHPISGDVRFTVEGTSDCSSSAPPSPSAAAGPENSPTVAVTAAGEGTDSQDTAVAVSSESGTFPTSVLLALGVVLLGGGAAVLARRRRGPPVASKDSR
ncbi:copper resistance CopC family protein [Micromonospora avicenniae]|uniref:copper resistance CopC family protein n=1 Tax=Micromonospora avicenniae TaxID=1198245 RepID=UPI003324C25F